MFERLLNLTRGSGAAVYAMQCRTAHRIRNASELAFDTRNLSYSLPAGQCNATGITASTIFFKQGERVFALYSGVLNQTNAELTTWFLGFHDWYSRRLKLKMIQDGRSRGRFSRSAPTSRPHVARLRSPVGSMQLANRYLSSGVAHAFRIWHSV